MLLGRLLPVSVNYYLRNKAGIVTEVMVLLERGYNDKYGNRLLREWRMSSIITGIVRYARQKGILV